MPSPSELVFGCDPPEHRLAETGIGHEHLCVASADVEVGLGDGHFDIRDERLHEQPVLHHLLDRVAHAAGPRRSQAGSHTKPARHDLT